MYQPEVKLRFVERYCNPKDGWEVFVDLDASELGNTGGARKTAAAKGRQEEMRISGQHAKNSLHALRVQVGGSRARWIRALQERHPGKILPDVPGDRDVVAININRTKLIVAEAEGDSSRQPEQKLYEAIGQIVIASGEVSKNGYETQYVLVFSGERVKDHATRAKALEQLGISALYLGDLEHNDELLFGTLHK